MSAVSFLICDPSAALQTFFQQLIAGYGFDAAAIKATGNPHAASEMALSLKPDFLVPDWVAKESVTGIALHRQPHAYGLITQRKGETLAADGTNWPC